MANKTFLSAEVARILHKKSKDQQVKTFALKHLRSNFAAFAVMEFIK